MPKQTAQDIIDDLAYRGTSYQEEDDPDFSEVEQRLQTAQYYNLLLKESLFSDDSAAAQQVEGELREFIRARIKVLLGLEGARVNVVERDPVFSAEEILALKELAGRLLGGAYAPKEEPAKAPSSPVEPPKPETLPQDKKRPGPRPGTKYGPRKPTLRKVEVPQELRETPSAPQPTARPPVAAKKPAVPVDDPNAIEDLEPNPNTGARRVRQAGRILEQAVDPTDGAVLMNEKGMVIWKDITPPAAPGAGYVPMPTASSQPGAPMEQLGMQEVINNQQRLSTGPLSETIAAVLRG